MLNLKNHTILAHWNRHKCSTLWQPGGAFRRTSRECQGFSVFFERTSILPLSLTTHKGPVPSTAASGVKHCKPAAWGFTTQIPIRAVNQSKFLLCSVQMKGVAKRPCNHKLWSSKALLFLQWKTWESLLKYKRDQEQCWNLKPIVVLPNDSESDIFLNLLSSGCAFWKGTENARGKKC